MASVRLKATGLFFILTLLSGGFAPAQAEVATTDECHQSLSTHPTPRNGPQSRADKLMALKIRPIMHPSFNDPDHMKELLPVTLPEEATTDAKESAYMTSLYKVKLLPRSEEERLFVLMNFFKLQAKIAQNALSLDEPSLAVMDEIESALAQANRIRDHIVRANMRLVWALAAKFAKSPDHFDDLIGEGNIRLLYAVDYYDASRGYRFSTYATWVVRNHFFLLQKNAAQHRRRYANGKDHELDNASDANSAGARQDSSVQTDVELFNLLIKNLNDRELFIFERHYGLNGHRAQSMREIGDTMGVTRERVRQINLRALKKLLKVAHGLNIYLPNANDTLPEPVEESN